MKLIIIALIAMGCASNHRTPYQAQIKGQGFKDYIGPDRLRQATFEGNAHTKVSDALLFAKFRAVEICQKEQNSIANVIAIVDRSRSRTYSYSDYSLGIGGDWDEVLKYPMIDVIYSCLDKVRSSGLIFREISANQLKFLLKDLHGALQVSKVHTDSPNAGRIRYGDFIIRANGRRIQMYYQLDQLIDDEKLGNVKVDLIRDGKVIFGVPLLKQVVTDEMRTSQLTLLDQACERKDLVDRGPCRRQAQEEK